MLHRLSHPVLASFAQAAPFGRLVEMSGQRACSQRKWHASVVCLIGDSPVPSM